MTLEKIAAEEQVILNQKGQPEFVVLPVERYRRILKLLEVYGLGQAILETETAPRLSRKEALALLEEDER